MSNGDIIHIQNDIIYLQCMIINNNNIKNISQNIPFCPKAQY